MAMFGSFVCTYVAKKVNVGHEAYRAQAAVMEDWVVKTLDLIPEQATAHNLLGRACTPQENNSHFSLLNLAMLLGMKRVMAQRYSQSLIDDNWRGLWPDTEFVLPAHFSSAATSAASAAESGPSAAASAPAAAAAFASSSLRLT